MVSGTRYVGPMEFTLITGKGTPVAGVDITVTEDVVIFHVLGQEMGRGPRTELAAWLPSPDGMLRLGLLVFSPLDGHLHVSVDGSEPYQIRNEFVTDLLRVL